MTREKNARPSSPTIACRAMGGRGETESSARAETRCTPGRLEASHLSVVIITDLRRNAPERCLFVLFCVLAVGSIPVESATANRRAWVHIMQGRIRPTAGSCQ